MENGQGAEELVNALTLFGVTLCYPLLMASFEKLPLPEFRKVLRAIVHLSFRYNVIGKLQTNRMEEVYNRVAIQVFNGSLRTTNEVILELKDIYLADDEFRKYFELRAFNTNNNQERKVVRYILYELNEQLHDGARLDFETDGGTIEHILPESRNENWQADFTEEQHLKYLYMLGNLTLLEPTKNNKEAADKAFIEKVQVYANSKYAITKQIQSTTWTPKMIEHRQMGLAKTACGVWKVEKI
ncbi:MAG: HNH endonuclease [Lewinellaceae bacterium]|nr:HNH endonuclease [Lewinellaceae bacterium]